MKFKIFYYAALALISAYCLYGYFTGTGLSGWLVQKQFEYFGQAYAKLTVVVGIAILAIPLEIARYFVGRRNPENPSDENPFNLQLWIKSLAPSKLLLLTGAMLLPAIIGGGIFSYYYAKNQELLKLPVHDIDLGANPSVQIGDEHFVRFFGKAQEDYSYVIEQTRGYSSSGTTGETYTPLTHYGWNEAQPVRFIYYQTGYVPSNVTARFKRPANMPYEGEITDAKLPVYVLSEYEKAGLKIAEPYYVIRSDFFYEGKPRDNFFNNSAWLYLVGGVIASVIGLFVVALCKIQKVKAN